MLTKVITEEAKSSYFTLIYDNSAIKVLIVEHHINELLIPLCHDISHA